MGLSDIFGSKKLGVGITFAAAAAKSITGASLIGKIITSRRTVISGFFNICPTTAAVTTAQQNTISVFKSRLIAQPIHIPQKMTGKKCPPFIPNQYRYL